jgi:2'-5' RNA ligase
MRLFVALFPPKEYLDYFREVTRFFTKQKRNLKFVPIDQLHITVKFIGANVSDTSYEQIREILNINYSPVSIALSGISFGFPRERFPKILLAKIKSTDSLIDLSNTVHSSIQSLKLKDTIRRKNRYANNFHVTIARLKDNSQKSVANNIKSQVKNFYISPPPPCMINEMYLMESVLSPKGPTYRKLERIDL